MGAQVVTVNDVLDGHVALDIQCLDRIYLRRLRLAGSSNDCPAATGTPAPRTACASPSSTPSSTTGSWSHSPPPTSPKHPQNLRAALATITRHVDDYATRARPRPPVVTAYLISPRWSRLRCLPHWSSEHWSTCASCPPSDSR
jgi:hypothetical protein